MIELPIISSEEIRKRKPNWLRVKLSGRPSNRSAIGAKVRVLANNLPVASGVVIVNRNRIAVEVKHMLPKTPDHR